MSDEVSARWREDYYRTARPDPERVVFDTPIPVENPHRRKSKAQTLVDASVEIAITPVVPDYPIMPLEPEPSAEADEFKHLFDNL